MSKAIVWGQTNCSKCKDAVTWLRKRECEVEERIIGEPDSKWTKKDLIEVVPNARSVPQIFIDGKYIGGYNNLIDAYI